MTPKRTLKAALLSIGGVALTATAVVAQTGAPPPSPPPTRAPPASAQQGEASADQAPRRAIAVLQPTQGNDVRGVVTFEETPDGVRMQANVSGLPGGEHAYHVHVYGDCSAADATSAGPHYTFGPNDTGITGNLGELKAQQGSARDANMLPLAQLRGPRSIVGRAVVVHAKGNDPSQPPDGAAGARLACGVIGLDEGASGAQGGGSR